MKTDSVIESKAKPKKKKNKKKIVIIIISVILVLSTAGYFVGKYLYEQHLHNEYIMARDTAVNIDTFYDGVVISGIDMGGKTLEEAVEALEPVEESLMADININVNFGETSYVYTNEHFEYVFDTQAVVEEAYEYARSGDMDTRYEQVLDLDINIVEYEISCELLYPNVEEYVSIIAEELYTEPVNASVASFSPFESNMFSFNEGTKGYYVDEVLLVASIESILQTELKQGEIEVPTIEIDYSLSASDLSANTSLISQFSTTSTNTTEGNHNMSLALSRINGSVVLPGETLSFNDKAKNSNIESNGYLAANTISNGKVVEDLGGGICQAATTLYGAVMRADLEVVERNNHSWPSSYVEYGQDAAISYYSSDFVFKNDTDYPIYIKAYMSGTTLTVMLYGQESTEWDYISVVSWVTEELEPAETKYVNDDSLATGTTEIDTNSRVGYRTSGEKIYYKDGVEVKRESILSSYYPAIQGIVNVGTGS